MTSVIPGPPQAEPGIQFFDRIAKEQELDYQLRC